MAVVQLTAQTWSLGFASRGAALDRAGRLVVWGERVEVRSLADGRVLARRDVAAGPGCLFDVEGDGRDELVHQAANGDLRWLGLRDGRSGLVAAETPIRDCRGMVLHGRRGVLVMYERNQLRFFTVPERAGGEWGYREVYSFYSRTDEGGMIPAGDVDRDGWADLFIGNYWAQQPARFDESWRIFAINVWNEHPDAGNAASLAVELNGRPPREYVVAERAVKSGARLAVFTAPKDVKQLWTERLLSRELTLPQALLWWQGRIWVGENNGAASRLWRFAPDGSAREVVMTGVPLHTFVVWKGRVYGVGPDRIKPLPLASRTGR